ncbi:TetR/AcrR family transcriptional regulator [Actinomadura sp. DC4]|uniref:TetR/AcrR family transcriptional regulator n=1 Tax=Actinomadura sp. DC4 TaxID=3055069 RepID=UPI0025B21C66|nr:TetR/AcrR family transcriptional regulator [Actinomadura sp. DC4]MDN3353427.1 helix-turn-helix domain-containing protein [Actinomadura sp. DC4]
MTERLPHYARSDARDNRERILEAAGAAFAAEGVDVTMRDLARRAGVGTATLYRHFPTKEILATEAFTRRMAACADAVERGLADPDPWRGFRTVVEEVCVLHALDQGFASAFTATFPRAVDLSRVRERGLRSLALLARRAKDAGALRADFVLDDLILALMAHRGIRAESPAATAAAARRLAALLIRSFRA